MPSSLIESIRQRLLAPKRPERPGLWLSSGLTLLDLAISGEPGKGFLAGHFYTLTGSSSSGKTWLLLQAMTEAAIDPRFRKYRLVYDQPERGALMDYRRYFGPLADRIEDEDSSRTLEGFYARVGELTRAGKPFFLGLDSEDSLQPEAGKSGGYGLEKAKLNSSLLRVAHNGLERRGSILVMIKQARQNINAYTAKFQPQTRSGGTALGYYACCEVWFKVVGKIRKNVLDKKRVVGSLLQMHVTKNRASGRDHAVTIPFHPSLGFDETGSMVRWLAEEGRWPCKVPKGRTIDEGVVSGLGLSGTWDKVAQRIEEKELVGKLREEVASRWREVEAACEVKRRPRY